MGGGAVMTLADITEAKQSKAQMAKELTSYMLHKHYCENDMASVIELLDDELNWFGAAEHEYAIGGAKVASIFREFEGKVPKCILSDEHYDVLEIAPDAWLCTGMLWVETDPSTGVFLRVHQRVATIFRWKDGTLGRR